MKATKLYNNKEPHLKVVKSSSKNKSAINKIYINTLIPGFSYLNSLGKTVTPKNCVML